MTDNDFDLYTRLGRVQASWWLRDQGAPYEVQTPEHRRAYVAAHHGHDECNIDDLAGLIAKYRETE